MQVPHIDTAMLRLLTSLASTPAVPGFSAGERLTARVVERLPSGDVRLEVGGRQILARPAVQLLPGQILDLEVVRTAPDVELRLLQGSARFSEQAFAEAVLGQARREMPAVDATAVWRALLALPPDRLAATVSALSKQLSALLHAAPPAPQGVGTPAPAAAGLAAVLEAIAPSTRGEPGTAPHASATTAAAVGRALAQWLGPLDGSTDAGLTALALRRFAEQGGLLFETRLRAALAAAGAPTASAPGTGLPHAVVSDARVLLALLGRSLPSAAGPALGTRPPATGRLDAEPAAQLASAAAADTVTREHVRLTEHVLARQVELAYHWVKDGVLRLDVPLDLPFGRTTVRVRLSRDGAAPGEPGPAEGHVVQVTLALGPLGFLEANARWHRHELSVSLYVEHDTARALVEPLVPGLVDGLRASGFTDVAATLGVDPGRFQRSDVDAETPPAGGGVFSARV
jgi:hypothetical protein